MNKFDYVGHTPAGDCIVGCISQLDGEKRAIRLAENENYVSVEFEFEFLKIVKAPVLTETRPTVLLREIYTVLQPRLYFYSLCVLFAVV